MDVQKYGCFYDLEANPGAETKNGTNNKMYSKIHFYFADLSYKQYEETKEITFNVAFCDLGNVAGFYWGMSIISFFHVVWYVPRCMYDWWIARKRNAVAPQIPGGGMDEEDASDMGSMEEEEEEE